MERHTNTGQMVGGILLGAAIGAGLALLFAPASGRTTRRAIGEKARHLKDGAQEKLHDLSTVFTHRTNDIAANDRPLGRREVVRAGTE